MFVMSKHRPLGVTILAVWVLACSVLTIILAGQISYLSAIQQLETCCPVGSFEYTFGQIFAYVVTPLAGYYYGYDYQVGLPLGVLYAALGAFALKGNKVAWFGNAGLSVVTIVSVAIASSFYVYNYLQYSGNPGYLDPFYNQSAFMAIIVPQVVSYAVAALRLYYLFRQDVWDFLVQNRYSCRKMRARV